MNLFDESLNVVSPPTATESLAELEKPRKKEKDYQRPPLTPAQQALAADYLPLARALARPFKERWEPISDEFESAACLALVEAAQAYDSSHKVKFGTFARHRILGGLRDVQRAAILNGYRQDCDEAPAVVHLAPEMEQFGRVLGREPEPAIEETLDERDAFEHWLRKVPKRHAGVCRQVFLHDESYAEIAAGLAVSPGRVSVLKRQSLESIGDWYLWEIEPAGQHLLPSQRRRNRLRRAAPLIPAAAPAEDPAVNRASETIHAEFPEKEEVADACLETQ